MFRNILSWFLSNWLSILLALLLALTVWIVASLEENPFEEAELPAPVRINVVGLEPGLIITNDYPETTRVRVRTQQETWRSLSADDIEIIADLTGLGPGTHEVELIENELDTQATVLSMNPSHVRFEIEEFAEREMPVQTDVQGEPAIGFSQGNPVVSPSIVTVQGALSEVQKISELRATVPVEGLRDPVRTDVVLVALDVAGNQIQNVVLKPDTVTVNIPITQEAGFRDISIIVPTIGDPPPGYYVSSIRANPQVITVRGDPALIEAMQPYAETESIDLTNKTDDFTQQVRINLPLGVTPVQGQTVEVLVTIGAQRGSRTVLDIPVQAKNIGAGLMAVLSPETVDVILSGPLALLDSLDPQQDIIVTIDLEGLTSGRYQLEPEVEVVYNDVIVESIFPVIIEIEIQREESGAFLCLICQW
jgi:YbbR domain-containing protein